jgi:hypothetical protein
MGGRLDQAFAGAVVLYLGKHDVQIQLGTFNYDFVLAHDVCVRSVTGE